MFALFDILRLAINIPTTYTIRTIDRDESTYHRENTVVFTKCFKYTAFPHCSLNEGSTDAINMDESLLDLSIRQG